LIKMGIDYVQGYHIGRPQPIESLQGPFLKRQP
jgi:EAL domain-containing protein (putative c-di-GMP-specific phosphodiesterase class I)